MSENQTMWYYAQDDNQHGPIAETELRSLIEQGKLSAKDLIWREGMEDWRPARELDQIGSGSGSGSTAAPPPQPARESRAARAGQQLGKAATATAAWTQSLRQRLQGGSIILLGLLLVLLARGCESISERGVARSKARAKLAVADFESYYASRRAALETQRKALQEDGGRFQDLTAVENRITELDEQEAKEKDKLQDGRWLRLDEAAKTAQDRHDAASYWRQWLLLAGAAVLTFSLCGVLVSDADAPQRWLAVVLLAILLWSLLVGGQW